MKKKLSVLAIMALCISLSGCNAAPTATTNGGDKAPDVEITIEKGDGSEDEGSEQEATVAASGEQDLLARFVKGEEVVYDTDDSVDGNYNYEDSEHIPFILDKDSYNIYELVSRAIEVEQADWGEAILKEVSYAYIDLGKDGIKDLAICVVLGNQFMGDINDQFFISAKDEKLELLYKTQSAYRAYETLVNPYGLISSGGSSSAFEYVEGYRYLDADGELKFIYSATTEYGLGSVYGDMGGIYSSAAKYMDEIDDSWYFVSYSFEDPTIDYENFNYEEYLATLKYTADPADNPTIKKIFEDANVKLYSENEIGAIVDKKLLSLGISEEIYENRDDIEWKTVENVNIQEVIAYGPNPVYVKNVEELVDAIAPNTSIVLEPGEYNITDYIFNHSENIHPYDFESDLDNGYTGVAYGGAPTEAELFIVNIPGLTICSKDPENMASIVCEPRYACVLNFETCDKVRLTNLIMGHTPEEGVCSGDVLAFYRTDGIEIKGCDLYGCGAYGFMTSECGVLNCTDTTIHDCSYGVVEAYTTQSLYFSDCTFRDCREFTMFELFTDYATFNNCTFKNLSGDLLEAGEDTYVNFNACLFDVDAAQQALNYKGKGKVTVY